MIRDLNSDELFEKSRNRTGNPAPRNDAKDSGSSADKSSDFEEAMDATDNKNRLKDESMKERKDHGV